MRIAVDAMGSDGAPGVEVEGAVRASLDCDAEILLVGDEAQLNEKLAAYPKQGKISVVHAPDRIEMADSPVMAVRGKKNSSLMVALRQVKEGNADAVVSGGNTGAVMVGSRVVLGSIRGVARSAISQCLPTSTGRVVVLDLGANVDCTARHLCEFAEMGVAYSHYTLGVGEPRVGLLNIGEEMAKGGQISKEVHRNLSVAPHLNFVGNIEPKAMFNGDADVIVCDGFVGNLILKTSEAVAGLVAGLVKEQFESSSMNKLAAMLAHKSLNELKKKIDANEYGGAPLLGINGIVIIIHGSTKPLGVANAIHRARNALDNKLNEHISENIAALRAVEREFSGNGAKGGSA